MTRQTTTPTERAQAAVDVLQRRLVKLRGKERDARDQAKAYADEISAVEKRLTYAKQSPDLAQTTPVATGGAAVAGESV